MTIEDGKFYFIKDVFFDIFKYYGLMYGLFQYLLNIISTRKYMIIKN